MKSRKPTGMCTIRKKTFPDPSRPVMRLILPRASMWDNGSEIRIAFLSGKPSVKDLVRETSTEWLQHANLRFTYVKKNQDSHVRITFNSRQDSWSALGTECLDYSSNEATMNFGLLDEDPSEAYLKGVILHEFGHMIGCGHEHESPRNGGIPWDRDKAIKKYMRDFGWKEEDVINQIFSEYEHDKIRGSALDKKSIMMYPVSESITVGDFRVGWNTRLSEMDKEFIRSVYPFH